jgi:glyoxylase-like metal-dependent hydrolase (beta-lactamase superfamily II)
MTQLMNEEQENKELINRQLGPLTILFGVDNGKYPHGNSLLVKGANRTALIDPSLGVVARKDCLPVADVVLFSHIHEDHVAGLHLYPDLPCHCHEEDALGLQDLKGMMAIYGFEEDAGADFEKTVLEEFFYQPRPDVQTFGDGAEFDLGGVIIKVMHTPGHTRGHCCFIVEWEDQKLVYLGDIELTGFGPYYGDAWSSLLDFELSLEKLKSIDSEYWLTFHHKGLIESRSRFLEMLETFRAMIDFRENNLLEFLVEPRSMADIVDHRFIYRPGTGGSIANQVERRSMTMHLDRLLVSGRVSQEGELFEVVK